MVDALSVRRTAVAPWDRGRSAAPWALAAIAIGCTLLGCREERGRAQRRSWTQVRTSGGQPAALAALMMPHGAIRAGLGPHRVRLRSRLQRELGQPGETTVVEQSVRISVDGNSRFSARKNTHRQYGAEVIWTGRKLYARSRYGRFLERDPADAAEPKRIAERMYGLLPAYLRLLEPFVAVESKAHGSRSGRDAEHVLLKLADDVEGPPQVAGVAQKWRRTVSVKSLEGYAWLDEDSGAALKVSLTAAWTYALPAGPPPETGIPETAGAGGRGMMKLSFDQVIDRVGQVSSIEAPARSRTTPDDRRHRLELERQMVVGERPMAPDTL